MKTFQEFLEEAISRQHQQIKVRLAHLIKQHENDPEKKEIYKNILNTRLEKQRPEYPDYEGRESARKDKYLIPSYRTSSFPKLAGQSTQTKNSKKLRKQKALGEII